MTFESRLARLQEIATELEGQGMDLARALVLFEEGVVCLREAADELARAEGRVQQLIERADGTFDLLDRRE